MYTSFKQLSSFKTIDKTNYIKIKEENDFFAKTFKKAKRAKNIILKNEKTPSICKDLINKYCEKGYSLSKIEINQNLFKSNPLLEKRIPKLKESFLNHPKKRMKNMIYLKKLEKCIERLLHPGSFQEKYSTIESSNSIRNGYSDSDGNYYYMYKKANTKQNNEISSYKNKNKTHSTCINDNNITLSSIHERKHIASSHNQIISPSYESNEIVYSKDIKKILKDIQHTIKTLKQIETSNPTNRVPSESENPIKKQKTSYISPYKDNNKHLSHNQRNARMSIHIESSISQPHSIMNKHAVYKRMSLPCLDMKEMTRTFEANFIFSKFNTTKDFLEYTYAKLLSGDYRLVSELLKLHLKSKCSSKEEDNSTYTVVENKKLTHPKYLLNDINVLNKNIKKANITNKIRELYRNTPLYYKMLPKIQKMLLTEQKLGQMDKKLAKTITSKD